MAVASRATAAQRGGFPARVGLSVVVITQNERHNLPGCLESVAFADEVVVVDALSTDGTAELAAERGATLIQREWAGYAAQRQRGFEEAQYDWVLWLDADERVTPELADGIRRVLRGEAGGADGYLVPRRHHFMGDWLRHGGEYPGHQLRLVRREAARLRRVAVHETLDDSGLRLGMLEGALDHLSTPTFRIRLAKAIRYGRLAARGARDTGGAGISRWRLLMAPSRRAAYVYLRAGAYRDGWRGLLWAFSCGLEQAVIAWELLRSPSPKPSPPDPSSPAQLAPDPRRMAGIDTHLRISELIDRPGGGKVLDAGAGEGAFTIWLADHRYDVVALGIERSQYRCRTAPFLQCDLDHGLPFRSGSIEGIAAIEVLEHLENPMRFLRESARCLAPGGWLAVTTPNILSVSSKLKFVLSGHHLYFGTRDYHRNGHINPLSRHEVKRIAERAGLTVEARTYNVGKLPIPGIRHRWPLRHPRLRTQSWGDALILLLRKTGPPQEHVHRG